jgi:dihydroorotate dehydrogenase (NAD+) catalytic subunit
MTLETSVACIKMNNPTILASGIMDEDAGSMKRVIQSGAGAIVTKSIGIHPREGYPNPTLIELEHGFLNAMGLPNPGINHFKEEMKTITQTSVPIIGSIYGATKDEFTHLATKMQAFGASAVELNLSCPHARHYGLEVGSDPKLIKSITSAVKQSIKIPVFVKLSPNVTNIQEIATAAEQGNADAIVAINTMKAMKINIEIGTPVLSNKIGGYSGPGIKPIGIRCVYEIFETVKIPIIGVGGITTGLDAIEYLMTGASAVQIGSGIYPRDLDIFTHVCSEIQEWMKIHHYNELSELIGVAHK